MDASELTQEKIDSLISLYTDGKIDKAIEAIEKLIVDNSNESVLYNLLGVCQSAKDDTESAIESYNKAISINPEFAEGYFNLGFLYYQLNQYNFAIKYFEKSLSIKPDFFEVSNTLGKIYQDLDKPEIAIELFKKALNHNPDFAEAHYNLAYSLDISGRKNEAIEHYEKCIELNPNSIVAHNNLGKTFLALGNSNLAINSFEKVIRLDSNNAEAHNNLGAALQDLGFINDAIKYYETSISITPDSLTLNNLGIALQEIGKFNEAAKIFQQAIITNPNSAESYHNLSYLTDLSKYDAIVSNMNMLYANDNLDLSDRSLICLALAKVHENQGNTKDFFNFLHQGNALRKKELGYSIQESITEVEALKKIFSPYDKIQKLQSTKLSNKRVIFILGMPRSGTTLVEQIISSHKSVYGAGELKTLTRLVKPLINNFIEDDTKGVSQKAISFIQKEYDDSLIDLNFPEKIVTDKLPLNFLYIGFILTSFPNAKIIHLKRDPVATCWSNYRCSFTSRANGYSYDFDDLIKFYLLYQDLMKFWNDLYPNKIYELSYENLTENQEKETQKLLEYCNLEWDENCLNFHQNKRSVQTASRAQVRKKMYQGSSEDWKKYWTHLQPLVDGLKLTN